MVVGDVVGDVGAVVGGDVCVVGVGAAVGDVCIVGVGAVVVGAVCGAVVGAVVGALVVDEPPLTWLAPALSVMAPNADVPIAARTVTEAATQIRLVARFRSLRTRIGARRAGCRREPRQKILMALSS